MFMRLSGGRDTKVESPFLVFPNRDRTIPSVDFPDDVEVVAYKTGPKSLIDSCATMVIREPGDTCSTFYAKRVIQPCDSFVFRKIKERGQRTEKHIKS